MEVVMRLEGHQNVRQQKHQLWSWVIILHLTSCTQSLSLFSLWKEFKICRTSTNAYLWKHSHSGSWSTSLPHHWSCHSFTQCHVATLPGSPLLSHFWKHTMTHIFATSLVLSASVSPVTPLLCSSHPMSRLQAACRAQQTDFLQTHSQISQFLTKCIISFGSQTSPSHWCFKSKVQKKINFSLQSLVLWRNPSKIC